MFTKLAPREQQCHVRGTSNVTAIHHCTRFGHYSKRPVLSNSHSFRAAYDQSEVGLLESREQRYSCHRETLRASRDEALDKCSYVSTTNKQKEDEEEEGAIRNIKNIRNFMGHYLLKIVNLLSSLLVVLEVKRIKILYIIAL